MELKMMARLASPSPAIKSLGTQAKTSVGKPRKFVSFSSFIAFFSATRREARLSGWISEITRSSFNFSNA
jgi:hypothetical protein